MNINTQSEAQIHLLKPANKPLRVLQVIHSFGMGGAETWLIEVLRLWSKIGKIKMDFLVTSGNRGIFDEEAEHLGSTIHYIRYGRGHLRQFIAKFRRVLNEEKYDAIHDHQDFTAGWHMLIGHGLLPPIRVVHVHNPSYQIHNNYGVSASRRLTAAIGRRLVGRYATHITGTSRKVLTEYGFDRPAFQRLSRDALHCGFDCGRFLRSPHDSCEQLKQELKLDPSSRLILFAGRLDGSIQSQHPQTHKNSGFAIRVFAEAAKQNSQIHLLVAGVGEPSVLASHRELARSLDVGERVHLLGIRRDIEVLMAGSELLFFPSREEGLGMVAVEAQAAGIPILTSTGVPTECVVIPGLVRFVDLQKPQTEWVAILLEMLDAPKPDRLECNLSVRNSAFSIENSAFNLLDVYQNGRIGRLGFSTKPSEQEVNP